MTTAAARSAPVVEMLVTGPVATIAPTATLRRAAEQLTTNQLGLLVVVGTEGTRGVISERDLVRALADDLDVDVERVGDLVSDRPVEVPRDAPLREAAAAMLDAEVRHLLVVDRGTVVGVVSVRDVLAALVAEG